MFEVKQLGISGLKIICSVITIEKKVANWHNDIYLQSYSQALVRSDADIKKKSFKPISSAKNCFTFVKRLRLADRKFLDIRLKQRIKKML